MKGSVTRTMNAEVNKTAKRHRAGRVYGETRLLSLLSFAA